MNRSFTTREKILLLLLTIMILGVGYFKLFYQPMQEQITASQQRQIAAEDQFSVEAVRLQRMKNMQNEIEQFKQSGATVYSEIPPYDNIQNVMIQLNTILGQAKDYSISFQDVQKQDDSKLVIRPIELSFTATVHTVMDELYHCRFRCAIEQIAVSANENLSVNNDISVSLSITFYEKQIEK